MSDYKNIQEILDDLREKLMFYAPFNFTVDQFIKITESREKERGYLKDYFDEVEKNFDDYKRKVKEFETELGLELSENEIDW